MQNLLKIQPYLYIYQLDSGVLKDKFHVSSLPRYRVGLNEIIFKKKLLETLKFFDFAAKSVKKCFFEENLMRRFEKKLITFNFI